MIDYKTLFSQTKDLSLLLVEDYEPLRHEMMEILEDFFKTVVIAENGREALKIYQECHETHGCGFDLVISDIEMPLMNGIELSRLLRIVDENQQIIILSAHTDSDYLLPLINMGVAQFIIKPLEHEALMNILYDVSKKIMESKKENNEDRCIVHLGENYIWDKNKCALQQAETCIDLTRHEILLLQLMSNKNEQVCSNDDIIQDFYDNGIDISEKSIRNLVFKLRKKLPEKCITSIYGLGYKFRPIV